MSCNSHFVSLVSTHKCCNDSAQNNDKKKSSSDSALHDSTHRICHTDTHRLYVLFLQVRADVYLLVRLSLTSISVNRK